MISELEFSTDKRPSVRRAWAKLASRAVRMRSDPVVVALDLALAAGAFALMLLLRYDASIPDNGWSGFARFLPFVWGAFVLSNFGWGLYGQFWRHASLHEAQLLLKSGATVMAILLVVDVEPRFVPISVVVTGTVAATFLMALLRFQSRLFSFRRLAEHPGLGVVVIGSGDAGAGLVSDMLHSPRAGFRPVAVLDEDRRRHGRTLMGVPIVGGIDDLPSVVAATGANLAVFAMTNAPQETVQRATAAAEAADIAMKIVPGMSSAMRGGTSLRDIRDVQSRTSSDANRSAPTSRRSRRSCAVSGC